MRIISKFHDYYDSVQRQGMDKDVVYLREQKTLQIPDKYKTRSYNGIEMMYLGFCGQIYKICHVSYNTNNPDPSGNPIQHEILFYDFNEFKTETLKLKLTREYDFNRRWWKSSYDEFNEFDTKPLIELFHQYQVPIFLIRHSPERHKSTLILNPCLKNLKFHTIKDTFTTYQDIFQFVAGVLNSPTNKMVQISDLDKRDKHGFDKWSFKTMPKKKK